VTTAPTFNPANYPILGVYLENLSGERVEQGVLRGVEDEFMRAILTHGYSLAARSDIDRVLKEQRLQSSGITEEAIARVGRLLNVPAIVLITVNGIDTSNISPPAFNDPNARYSRTRVSMSARMIMAERAEVLWISSYTHDFQTSSAVGRPSDFFGRALQEVAVVVASGLPSRSGNR